MTWGLLLELCGVNVAALLVAAAALLGAAWVVVKRTPLVPRLMAAAMRQLMGGGPS